MPPIASSAARNPTSCRTKSGCAHNRTKDPKICAHNPSNMHRLRGDPLAILSYRRLGLMDSRGNFKGRNCARQKLKERRTQGIGMGGRHAATTEGGVWRKGKTNAGARVPCRDPCMDTLGARSSSSSHIGVVHTALVQYRVLLQYYSDCEGTRSQSPYALAIAGSA